MKTKEKLVAAAANRGLSLHTREIDLRSHAHDASHFILYPQALLIAESVTQVQEAFKLANATGTPITFRSGGTSLSGQGITDGLLVDTRKSFRQIKVHDAGNTVRVGPGATVRQINNVLRRYGRAFGPDPASEIAATAGGVLANNSSGMVCSTTENSYRTLKSLTFVLPSGTTINTADPAADTQLASTEPALYELLVQIRDEIRNSRELSAEVQRQFAMKNTMGYGLNSFLDYTTPLDILTHLLIGSEGTLAFIAEAELVTVPVHPEVATALLVFDTLEAATRILPDLVASGARAIELLDARSLKVAQQLPQPDPILTRIAVEQHAALLVEYQAPDPQTLRNYIENGTAVATQWGVEAAFSNDPQVRASLWKIRKGLFTAVASARRQGTTALLEDVVVPVAKLAQTCEELHILFDEHGYHDAVIFGHAKDGNIHFLLTDDFSNADSLARFEAFTNDLVDLILKLGGSLKAEHGTGRVMAPFVRRQYGERLHDMMRAIKAACDPRGILNPGVIITDDPQAHLAHLKPVPPAHSIVDTCVECGYCEPACPSKDLTLTPRQRIVTLREMELARSSGQAEVLAELERDYEYSGVETCAVDGMCELACPVGINTGSLVRDLRRQDAAALPKAVWASAAKHWHATTTAAGLALNVADKLPAKLVSGVTTALRKVAGEDTVPAYSADLPAGGKNRVRPRKVAGEAAEAVFFPSCLNTMFAPAPGSEPSISEFEWLCQAAGVQILIPEGVSSTCCGTPWSSKGMAGGYETMTHRTADLLWQASNHGELPVVCDASSCTEGLVKMLQGRGVQIIDAPEFLLSHIVPGLERMGVNIAEIPKLSSLTLHPTCSTQHLGTTGALVEVAGLIADEVSVPTAWGCCGFAGDRGMLHPELTASATAAEAEWVSDNPTEAYASSNRTCELGMSRATGQTYAGIIQLLTQQVRAGVSSK